MLYVFNELLVIVVGRSTWKWQLARLNLIGPAVCGLMLPCSV